MPNVNSVGGVLCLEVARLAVAEVAADELDMFDELTERSVSAPRIRDDALGFGIGEALQAFAPLMVTPIAFEAVRAAIMAVAPKLFDTALGVTKDLAKETIKKRLEGRPEARPHSGARVSFTADQLRLIRSKTIEHCAVSGIKDERAGRLADAIVARLATL